MYNISIKSKDTRKAEYILKSLWDEQFSWDPFLSEIKDDYQVVS